MDEQIDVEGLSRELVKVVRGSWTQVALSEELGFGSNVLYMWESGRRAPEMSRFFRMAELCGSHNPVRRFFEEARSALKGTRLSTPRGVQRLIEALTADQVKSHLADRIEVDRTTVGRWLRGETEPRLPDFLRLVRVTTQQLLPFVGLFADPSQLCATADVYADLEAQKTLAYKVPWSHAVLRALELSGYKRLRKHHDGYLVKHLGLGEKDVKRFLRALERAGQITWTGTHYKLGRVLMVDTRPDPAGNLKLKRHWSRVAQQRLSRGTGQSDALFSYNLFAVSDENLEQIRELHMKYYDAVRALIDDSVEADQVVLMNLQLVPLGGQD